MRRITDIERITGTSIKRRNIPTYEKVMDVKSDKFTEEIKYIIDNENLEKQYVTLNKLIQAQMSEDEIIVALLKKLKTETDSSKTKADINETFENRGRSSSGGRTSSGGRYSRGGRNDDTGTRFHVNIGKKHNLNVSDILDFVRSKVRMEAREIQDIAILTEFSFFTVPKKYGPSILSSCNHKRLKGKSAIIQVSRKRK